jgi:hypothetical protein
VHACAVTVLCFSPLLPVRVLSFFLLVISLLYLTHVFPSFIVLVSCVCRAVLADPPTRALNGCTARLIIILKMDRKPMGFVCQVTFDMIQHTCVLYIQWVPVGAVDDGTFTRVVK